MRNRRSLEGWDEPVLAFTDKTAWLEESDARRAVGPEELLSALEDRLERGELSDEELIHCYTNNVLPD